VLISRDLVTRGFPAISGYFSSTVFNPVNAHS